MEYLVILSNKKDGISMAQMLSIHHLIIITQLWYNDIVKWYLYYL